MIGFSSKKGQLGNVFLIILLLLFLTVGSLILHFTFSTVTDAIVSDGTLTGDAEAMAVQQQKNFPLMMDGLVLLSLVIFILLMIYAASTADNNPVLFAILLL